MNGCEGADDVGIVRGGTLATVKTLTLTLSQREREMQTLLLAEQPKNVIILFFCDNIIALAFMVEIRHDNAVRSVTGANRRVGGGSDCVSPAKVNRQRPVFIIRDDNVGGTVTVQVTHRNCSWIMS